ncbi:MAG: histidinol-phosphatase HisJ family protein [Syntrophomonas sp.]|uniref:histidinol-phosphatase HisJ family protein n=1 Tax=Syntrophomonas sp. TaxID=2053627 RepID=UPI00260DAD0B|nr:histidinol-phosphatase HisJ family protein [Syntrophomonas sp.]MDD2511313.1 histidinol-phosphatase HisJ family protein [Syntrophomonas sp.]MDD3878781.1 histidinol-phosphatase HisJ family protein [Syntrophomonas sp.]MDD4625918.1 histidinol-phosphatase HisJ family protein [Syntrophomonas sp.]
MLLDYHIHALAHGEYDYDEFWIRLFAENARQKKLVEIGFSEHDEYLPRIKPDKLKRVQEDFPKLKIRIGLEVDYHPGREEEIQRMLAGSNYDYIIGSIHFIDGWGFDHPDFKDQFATQDIDDIYADYFSLVNQAVNSRLFDVVGHMDLIKIWGHRPVKQSVQAYVEPVLNSIKAARMVIEINSSGLRKPVGEIYPAREIMELMLALDIPITLGSDAHHPSQLGEGLEEAACLAKEVGYRQLVTFSNRRRELIEIG